MTRVVELQPTSWSADQFVVNPFTISAVHLIDHPEGYIEIELVTVCGHRERVWQQEDQKYKDTPNPQERNTLAAQEEVKRITALLWPSLEQQPESTATVGE